MHDFYFKYFGNKRSENDELLHLLPEITETCTTIVEPFGGTCSFSRWLFGKNADVEYYLNDINAHCTSFCNNFHEKADEIIDAYNSLVREFLSMDNYEQRKVAFKKLYGELATDSASDTTTNAKYLFYTRHNLGGWRAFLHNRENIIRYIDKPKYYKQVEESTKFFKITKYHCGDYKQVFDRFKNDENALLYIDPPYYNTNNEGYEGAQTQNEKVDTTEIMRDIYNLFKTSKCKIIFIIKSDFFCDTLFADYLVHQYKKKYMVSRGTHKHSVFFKR